MVKLDEIVSSVNRYDKDGDSSWEEGIYLHFENTTILVAKDLKGWKDLVEHINGMTKGIEENL